MPLIEAARPTLRRQCCSPRTEIQPAGRPERLPTVLARRGVLALLDRLEPPFRLMGEIFYGSGLCVARGPLGVISPLDR